MRGAPGPEGEGCLWAAECPQGSDCSGAAAFAQVASCSAGRCALVPVSCAPPAEPDGGPSEPSRDDCSRPFVVPLGAAHPRQNVPLDLTTLKPDFELTCGAGTGADGLFVIDPPAPVAVRIQIVEVGSITPLHFEVVRGRCALPSAASSLLCEASGLPSTLFVDGPVTLYVKADSARASPVLVSVEAVLASAPPIATLDLGSSILAVAISPASSATRQVIAAGTAAELVQVEAGTTDAGLAVTERSSGFTTRVVFSPDGGALAALSTGNLAAVRAPGAVPRYLQAIGPGARGGPYDVAWSLDGAALGFLGADQRLLSVRLFQTEDLDRQPLDLDAGSACPACEGLLSFDPGGALVVASGWRLARFEPDGAPRSEIRPAFAVSAVSGDGQRFLGHDADGNLWLLDAGGAVARTLGRLSDLVVTAQVFSPSGARAAAGGLEGQLLVVEVSTGQLLWESRAGAAAIRALAFSPDDRLLVTGGQDGTLRLWQLP